MTVTDWSVATIYIASILLSIWIMEPRFYRKWRAVLKLRFHKWRHRDLIALGRTTHEQIERSRRIACLQEKWIVAEAITESEQQVRAREAEAFSDDEYRAEADGKRVA